MKVSTVVLCLVSSSCDWTSFMLNNCHTWKRPYRCLAQSLPFVFRWLRHEALFHVFIYSLQQMEGKINFMLQDIFLIHDVSYLQWTTMGPASGGLQAFTRLRKARNGVGCSGTPWSGQAVNWNCLTSLFSLEPFWTWTWRKVSDILAVFKLLKVLM